MLHVIGDEKPRGICGSGIVELVAKYGKDAPAKVGAYVAEMKAALAK